MLAAYPDRVPAGLVERDEADAAFDDQRVVPAGDHMAEAHPPDRVGGQPRLHPDFDRDAVETETAPERSAEPITSAGRSPTTPATPRSRHRACE